MRSTVLPGSFSLPARRAFAPLAALLLAACIWLPGATASGSVVARTTAHSAGSFDHCLLGSWRLKAATGAEATKGDLVGMTMQVVLGHGLADGNPFGVMTVNLTGSALAKTFGKTLRGRQAVAIGAGGNGEYGAVRMISNHVVAVLGASRVPQPAYVLGTLAMYKCSSSQIRITFFDNADLGSATFARI